jgi:hypothetical protein
LTQTQKMDIIQLKEEDWNLLLRFSKQVTLTRNEVLINQNENPFKLFRVISGTCRIESVSSIDIINTLQNILYFLMTSSYFSSRSLMINHLYYLRVARLSLLVKYQ